MGLDEKVQELDGKTNKLHEAVENIKSEHAFLIRNYDKITTSFEYLQSRLQDISDTLLEIKDLQQKQIHMESTIGHIQGDLNNIHMKLENYEHKSSKKIDKIIEDTNAEFSKRDKMFIKFAIGGLVGVFITVLGYILTL